MRLIVLGSSGTYPAVDNPASSFLVSTESTTIWCDAGPGSFQQLLTVLDPADLDAIVLSHRHPDHCIDVLAAFHALAYRPEPVQGLPLLLGPSVRDRLLAFLGADGDHRIHETFDFLELEDGATASVGDIDVVPVEMSHSAPTFGTRYGSEGRSLFYTADTGRGSWEDRVGPVDLLVSEATFQSDDPEVADHLTAIEAGRIAASIGAARLLLTHIPPHLDPARSVREASTAFDGPVTVAVPGTTHEV